MSYSVSCRYCQVVFQALHRGVTVCKDCKTAHRTPYRESLKNARCKVQPHQPRQRRVILTDQEQQRINQSVDSRAAIRLEARTIQPGSPEFMRISAELYRRDVRA